MRCSHGHRPLGDLETATTAGTLLGAPLAFPIILAPVACQRLAHPDGELATVPGASAASAWMTVSTLASVRMEEIAKAAQTVLWFQLDMQERREATLRLVRRAEAAGYRALMVTVDAAVNGVRNEEQRAGFNLARHVRPANLDGSRVRARVPCSRACSPKRQPGRTSPGSEPRRGCRCSSRASCTHSMQSGRLPPAPTASSSPTTAGARSTRCQPASRRSRWWHNACAAGCPCWSTAASGAAPLC